MSVAELLDDFVAVAATDDPLELSQLVACGDHEPAPERPASTSTPRGDVHRLGAGGIPALANHGNVLGWFFVRGLVVVDDRANPLVHKPKLDSFSTTRRSRSSMTGDPSK